MNKSDKRISILGLGWLGLPLAHALQADGYTVIGSKTSSDGVKLATQEGIKTYLFNATENFYLKDPDVKALFDVDCLIITLPPRAHHPLNEYFPMIRAMVKTSRYCGVKQLIFTSSTSVYGNCEGELDEDTDTQPISDNGRVLKKIETFLLDQKGLEISILRLGGLIGAGRHPIKHLAGREEIKNPEGVINLVHQTDVINAIRAIVATDPAIDGAQIFNIVAPNHPTRQEYYEAMAQKAGLSAPHFMDANADDPKPRIIVSDKFCAQYGFKFTYPDPFMMPY